MRKPFFLALALLVLSTATTAQPQVQWLQLDSCKALALRNQAAMKNAALEVEMAKETRRAALTKFFPSVSLMAAYYHSQHPLVDLSTDDERDKIEITSHSTGETLEQQINDLQQRITDLGLDINVRQFVESFIADYGVDVSIRMLDHGAFANALAVQPIFAGGRIVNGNRLAKLGVEAAEEKANVTRNEVEMTTEQYYWRVVSLNEKLKTLDRFQTLLDTLEHDAAAAVEAGVLSRNEWLKVRLKQNESSALRIQLTHGIALATRALCQYVGLPFDENTAYRFDSLPYDIQAEMPLAVNPSQAVEGRAESRLLQKAVDAARLQKAMAVGEALPQVSVGATYGTNNLLGNEFRQNGMVFATVNVPLTAWWETAHKVRKENLQRRLAENQRDDLLQQMQLQTLQAWNELSEAWQLVYVRREAVDNAQENLRETGHYYKAGLISLSDYLEAQTLLQQAHDQLIDQLIAFQLKSLQYSQMVRL